MQGPKPGHGPLPLRQYPGQPLPYGEAYNPDPMYANPSGTIPGPPVSGLPYSQWQSARTPLNWTNPIALDIDYVTAGYWQSPLYDLRPEIRSADGSRASGVPIWASAGRKLWVQVDGLLTESQGIRATDNLFVVSREYGNIFDPLQILRVGADADITADVAASGTNQPPSVILSFLPPGSGYHVRYWRLELVFRRLDRVTFPLAISAAFY